MNPGDIVENFTLQNQDGKDVSLSDFKDSPVVLFFYPRADTPGCTIADPDMVLINRYDLIKPKNMYGKLVKGVKRTTYLIGPDTGKGQRLIHTFEEVKPEGHAEEVLALLKANQKA